METSGNNCFLYGSPYPLPAKHFLQAGSLKLVYDHGCIRHLSANGTELLRNIYSAVRDRNWGTLIPEITDEKICSTDNEFEISYTARYTNTEIDFIAEYRIEGRADNRVVFIMKGRAMRSFLKNRIGFCVLHPLQGVRGKECTILSPGMVKSISFFPERVSPDAPMMNIASMEWETDAAKCSLSFEGDTWEMEDQRNWTDTSYKTFCTPLSVPYPVEISEGTLVEQRVSFQAAVKVQNIRWVEKPYSLFIERKDLILPEIGIGSTGLSDKLTSAEFAILQEAHFSHFRFDIRFSQPDWSQKLGNAIFNARAIGTSLELVLHLTPAEQDKLTDLKKYLYGKDLPAVRIWVVEEKSRMASNELLGSTLKVLRDFFPGSMLGGGTDAYFAEFNRSRIDASSLDFVTFAITPQVHAFDNESLIENLEAQSDVMDSAKQLYPGKKVQVSPVTLKQRFNMVATVNAIETPRGQLPYPVDERQMSLFAAGWTLGSLAALASSGVFAVTYYEATGWQGIIQGDAEPPNPVLFKARKGDIFPVYHLFSFINNLQVKSFNPCRCSHPLGYSAINLENIHNSVLVLANHTSENRLIHIDNGEPSSFKELTGESMALASRNHRYIDEIPWLPVTGKGIRVMPFSLSFVELEKHT